MEPVLPIPDTPSQSEAMVPLEYAREIGARLVMREQEAKEREEHMRNLEEQSRLDLQTGLLNHKYWHTLVQEAVELEHEDFGILFIDVTALKTVNDNLGHDVGDELLAGIADILKNNLRSQGERDIDLISINNDTIEEEANDELPAGRLGGDEFGILCDLLPSGPSEDYSAEEALGIICERLRKAFNTMIFEHRDSSDLRRLGFEIAIGGSIWKPGKTARELLREADQAMYDDKQKFKQERLRKLFTAEEREQLRAVRHLMERAGTRTEFLD